MFMILILENLRDLICQDLQMDQKKYEVAVIGVPTIVEDYFEKNIRHTKSSTSDTSQEGYELGNSDGRRYDIKQNNLLDIS